MYIPRYLALLTELMDPAEQIKFITVGGEFNMGLITSRFQFLAFNVSLLAIIQSLTLFISIFNLLSNRSKEDELTSKQVSSANKRGTLPTLLRRSLIYDKNSKGPRVEPRGNPMSTSRNVEPIYKCSLIAFCFLRKIGKVVKRFL